MNKKVKMFLINSFIVTISSLIFRVLSVYFNSYIAGKIGKEMLGAFNLVMAVYVFGITLGNFGINFAVIRLVAEELAVGNKDGIQKTTKKCIKFGFIFGIIASIIFLTFSDFIVEKCLHNKMHKNVIYVICFALPLISVSSVISGYFVAIRRAYKSTIAQFFEQIIKIFITAFFLEMFLPKGLDYACFSLVLGDLVSEIISFICNSVLCIHDMKRYKTSYFTNQNLSFYNKKILKIATPVALTTFIKSGLSTLKQIIIPLSFEKIKLDCSTALSIYGEINCMAMPIIVFPNVIFLSISGLFVPEFATYNAQKRTKSIKKITSIILVVCFAICVFIMIILFIFSSKLGNLIYNDISVGYYIKILSPISLFILFDCVIDNILKGLDAQNDVMIINIIDIFINIILIYTLVPKLGISGYILSMYFSEIFNLTLSMSKLVKIVYFKSERN